MAKEMNMQYEKTSYAGDVQILKREPNEAIPLTLDFDGVTTKNAQGKKIVKAGTPIGADGAGPSPHRRRIPAPAGRPAPLDGLCHRVP